MTTEEVQSLAFGDIVTVKWSASSQEQEGTVLAVKHYGSRVLAEVKTGYGYGMYSPEQIVGLVKKAPDCEGLIKAVRDFIEAVKPYLGGE